MTDPLDQDLRDLLKAEQGRIEDLDETRDRVKAAVMASIAAMPPADPSSQAAPPSDAAPPLAGPAAGGSAASATAATGAITSGLLSNPVVWGTIGLVVGATGGSVVTSSIIDHDPETPAVVDRTVHEPDAHRPDLTKIADADGADCDVLDAAQDADADETLVLVRDEGEETTPTKRLVRRPPEKASSPRPSKTTDASVDQPTKTADASPEPSVKTERTNIAEERRLIQRARAALTRGRPDAALVALMSHERRFPNGVLSQERDSLVVQALAAAGRPGQARARANRFKKQHPGSIYSNTVNKAVKSLKTPEP